MKKEKNIWKPIFFILLFLYISLIVLFDYLSYAKNKAWSAYMRCASAIQCTGDDPSKQTCHYYEEDGSVSSDTIICNRSGNQAVPK